PNRTDKGRVPAEVMPPTPSPLSTPEKLIVCGRLHRVEALQLADFFGMTRSLRDALTAGLEAQGVWEYAESIGRLAELPTALLAIGREDLAALLQHRAKPQSILLDARLASAVVREAYPDGESGGMI